MSAFNRITTTWAICLLLLCGLVFSLPLNAKNLTVNIQCNDCFTDYQFEAAALNRLTDRQQAIVNVINFSRFEVRKYYVNKLAIEVCTDYKRSATKGFCKLQDRSTVQALFVLNLERERFFAFAEYLAQQDFFKPNRLQVNAEMTATAWTLLLDENRLISDALPSAFGTSITNQSLEQPSLSNAAKWQSLISLWKQQEVFVDFKTKWSQVASHSVEANTLIDNLSPVVEFEFVDKSLITAVINHNTAVTFDLDFQQLSDQYANRLMLNRSALFSHGDSFRFASIESDGYKVLIRKANNTGFMLSEKNVATGIEVTLLACVSTSAPCGDENLLRAGLNRQ